MRAIAVSAAVLVALFSLTACGSVGASYPMTRQTPAGTIEWFKAATRNRDYRAEWNTFSPRFQGVISGMAGRNVDFADYALARRTLRQDPRVRIADSLLARATIVTVQQQGENRARVLVRAGLPPFVNEEVNVGLVRMAIHQLYVRSEANPNAADPQPFEALGGDSSVHITPSGDGGYVVQQYIDPGAPPSEIRVPAPKVWAYRTIFLWYIDDLGGMESQLMGG